RRRAEAPPRLGLELRARAIAAVVVSRRALLLRGIGWHSALDRAGRRLGMHYLRQQARARRRGGEETTPSGDARRRRARRARRLPQLREVPRLGLDHGLDPATSLFVVLRTLLLFHRDLPLEVRPTEKRPAILSNAPCLRKDSARYRWTAQSLSRTGLCDVGLSAEPQTASLPRR